MSPSFQSRPASDIHRTIQAYWGDSRGEHHRYRSWEHCYGYFHAQGPNGIRQGSDTAALHLGFYLASWGMYRGSSFLLQRDYRVHESVIGVLADAEYADLWGVDFGASSDDSRLIPLVMRLVSAIRGAYQPFVPATGSAQPTDTLVTKIVLGTLGLVPACDRFFIEGLKITGLQYSYVNEAFLRRMVEFCSGNLAELHAEQAAISRIAGTHYPLMKLVDMYFWQLGVEGEADANEKSGSQGTHGDTEQAQRPPRPEGESMFWVYENWMAEKKAVLHRAECGHCNNGQGSHPNPHGDRNGCWHGPFQDYAAARAAAEALPDRDVRDCSHCV